MAGHQLADAAEERALVADVAEGEILGKQRFVELGADSRVREQRLDLAAEDQQAAVPEIVEGLVAQPVAGAEEAARVACPRWRSANMPRSFSTQAGPYCFVGVEDGLGVAAVGVAVAGRLRARGAGWRD